ncbi:membrane-spanning 4-domains subfamily A member 13 [Nycticebus coucang]|uniref:membrane-spanning 4-domains subfamily A member 13 n=1 Tax=Nycticebus coucang TaxID=9470 RepID=UPI00234E1A30|nr:membrane-spanning 4-domains subfamily A member 13 [Nycticebus coucang]
MIGIFEVLMWYFLLVLYMGQIKGVFGKYEPITYKTGCCLWGIFPITSGAIIIRVTKHPSRYLISSAFFLNIFCIITTIIAIILTIIELASFKSLSYRNYGQAKLGRQASRILLFYYFLEIVIALVYTIYTCMYLVQGQSTTRTQPVSRCVFFSPTTQPFFSRKRRNFAAPSPHLGVSRVSLHSAALGHKRALEPLVGRMRGQTQEAAPTSGLGAQTEGAACGITAPTPQP